VAVTQARIQQRNPEGSERGPVELFGVLVTAWRFRFHIGLAFDREEVEPGAEPGPGPLPHLAPVDAPLPVVFTDDMDPELLRQRIGFR
jgi:hypothetical protein